MIKQQIGIYILLLMMSVALPALGDGEAKKAFKQGAALYRENRFAEAADAFRKAYSLRPSWKIFFNIGQCSAAAKQYGLALEAFESYLSQGGDDVPAENRANVVEEIRILRDMVGYLAVDAPEGAEVVVDGIHRGTTPLPGSLAVGTGVNHELELRQDDSVFFRKIVRVSSGKTLNVDASGDESAEEPVPQPSSEVDAEPEADGESMLPEATTDRTRPLRIAGWTTTGIGIAALGSVAATGMLALKANEAGDKDDEVKTYQLATNILLGVGSTLTVAGVTMVIVSYVSRKKEREKSTPTPLSVVPAISPDGFSFSLTHRF